MLAETLMALAALAGDTVVTAATTDAWEAARRGFARLLGRGDPERAAVAERRLAETHERLAGVAGADLESARAALEAQWAMRLADLLEEDPRASRMTCVPWYRTSARHCLPEWCLRPVTQWPPGEMSTSPHPEAGWPLG